MKYAFFVAPGRCLAALLLTGLAARAQAPTWQTAVVGNGGRSEITSTAADASGNVYVAGSFEGTLVLGDLAALTSAGQSDAFVAKWSPATKRFVWAQRAGGPGADVASGVAVSGANVYVVGYFDGTAGFGATSLTSAGSNDVFVAKLADTGSGASFAWAQRAGGPSIDVANGVAVSGANVYVAGDFRGTAGFGATSLVSAGSFDVFVAKLVDAGSSASFAWAQRAGGPSVDRAFGGVAVSGANVYVSGIFNETAGFGATSLVSAGSDDAFVAKLTDAGSSASFAWAQRAGGPSFDQAFGVAVSGANVYVAGIFNGTAGFGATSLTSAGNTDVFVTKLTDAGPSASFAWAQRAGGPSIDVANGVAVSGANVYVVGRVRLPASFGTLTFASPAGNDSGFLASLGEVALAARAAGPLAGLTLAPNPAHATATVQVPAVPGATQATLTLLDARGRAVRTQHVVLPATGAAAELALTGLSRGLYHVRVEAGERQTSRALVVE